MEETDVSDLIKELEEYMPTGPWAYDTEVPVPPSLLKNILEQLYRLQDLEH